MRDWLRALEAVKEIDSRGPITFGSLLNDLAALHHDSPALIDEQVSYSYRDLAQRVNRYAHWAQSIGLAAGSVVGLMMPNSADYVAAWAGLSHFGCVVALINTQLSGPALAHAIGVSECRVLIVETSLASALTTVLNEIDLLPIWSMGEPPVQNWPRLDRALLAQSAQPWAHPTPSCPKTRDPALLIFTSGTTGLPKAARLSHGRILQWSYWFAGLMNTTPTDRLYDCLPMYHSTGGVSAIGALLVRGGAVVIRRRFSVSRFWDDVADQHCTIVQYIGELCRYLLQAPEKIRERHNTVRLFCGNGLRAEVWQDFQDRFDIPRILEFYAATEGPVSLYNCEGKPGAIGQIPGFLAHRFPFAIAHVDPETGSLARDERGLCRPCGPDETGEALGLLEAGSQSPARHFDGYTDAAVSARKLAADVLHPGDLWYRTGDLMRRDREGFVYFVDRLGDAFRWKGENVSASEVAAVIGRCEGVVDAVAFGVAIPGTEGKAGMVALSAMEGFQMKALHRHVHSHLPPYARPVFVRICPAIAHTGTFKMSAYALAQEGYRPKDEKAELWFDHRAEQRYRRCCPSLLSQIESGSIPV